MVNFIFLKFEVVKLQHVVLNVKVNSFSDENFWKDENWNQNNQYNEA